MTTLPSSNVSLFKVLASPFLTLQQALSVGDDFWTWTTRNGDIYEDVELVSLTRHEVTFRHEYGISTIARADLTREIQQRLIDNSEMSEPDFADDGDLEADRPQVAAARRASSCSKVA